MLLSRGDDATSSVTEQSVAILKRKWQNINSKVEERKVIHGIHALLLCMERQFGLDYYVCRPHIYGHCIAEIYCISNGADLVLVEFTCVFVISCHFSPTG